MYIPVRGTLGLTTVKALPPSPGAAPPMAARTSIPARGPGTRSSTHPGYGRLEPFLTRNERGIIGKAVV